jgi:hypothetical protein
LMRREIWLTGCSIPHRPLIRCWRFWVTDPEKQESGPDNFGAAFFRYEQNF